MNEATLLSLSDELVEKKTLAMMMLDPLEAMSLKISKEDFSTNAHKTIFTAIVTLGKEGGEVDYLQLIGVLRQEGNLEAVGGSAELAEMVGLASVFNLAQLKSYVAILFEYHALRELWKVAKKMQAGITDGVPSDTLLQQATDHLGKVSAKRAGSPWKSLGEFTKDAVEMIDQASQPDAPKKVKTGLKLIDHKFYQILDPENLVILAARPSMGKSSLMLGIALDLAEQGLTSGIVSLEMSGASLAKRAILLKSEHLNIHALDHGTLTSSGWFEITEACMGMEQVPIYLTDDSTMSLPSLSRKAKELQRMKGLDVLFVDYLQLMEIEESRKTRNESIGEISRGLKVLARELKAPVVCLSQLSRECEKRADKRPVLADLRDSGAIEQDADVVWMIYRDEVYDQDTADKGIAEMIIRKNRNGPTGEEKVRFIQNRTRFEDL